MTHAQKQADLDPTLERRRVKREAFLAASGYAGATLEALAADASFRRYYRILGAHKPMLLMEDPPDRPPVPPYVMVEPYIKIDEHLRSLGLHAPKILHKDVANGLLIIEDFGDDTYTRLFAKGEDAKALYELAVDALIHLHSHPRRNDIDLPEHDAPMLVDGAMLLLDWYYPALTGHKPTDEMKNSFAGVWKDLLAKLPTDQRTLVLRDYHVDNLMIAPGQEGLMRCGLLDFQDAAFGQFAYDLMSLLEDARRDVPAELRAHLYDRYLAAMKINSAAFGYAYRVLAAQRHARVLGVFVRLSVRDGKPRYLQWIPHVHKLFLNALNEPALAPLKQWFHAHAFDIEKPLNI